MGAVSAADGIGDGRPRRFAYARDKVADFLGFSGTDRASRKFFRLAFAVRGLILAVTPTFLLLPGSQYSASTGKWSAYALLIAWTSLLAFLTYWNDEFMKRALWLYYLDLAIVFAVFVLTTHATAVGSKPSYSQVVIAGTFQLQTYGAVITGAALGGMVTGLGLGIAGAGAYIVSLRLIGNPTSYIFDASHVQGTLMRLLLYLICGVLFGMFNVVMGRLIFAMQQIRGTVERAVEVRTARAQERLRDQIHESALTDLEVLGDALVEIHDLAHGQIRQRLRVARKTLDATIVALKSERSDDIEGDGIALDQIIRSIEAPDRIRLDSHPMRVDCGDDIGGLQLPRERAKAFERILAEVTGNSIRHALAGEIVIRARLTVDACRIVVTDAGPDPAETPGRGRGKRIVNERARQHGWSCSWGIGEGEGGTSYFLLEIPIATLSGG